MDFRQLQYLTTVAEYQNITKAAEALYISQSAMSHYIQKAEEELGIQLFDRSTTPITLTYAGTRYMETARKILLENEQLMKEFRDITQHMTGKLRVGTSRDRASYMMPRLIPEFTRLYPGIEIVIFTQSSQQLKEALRNGRIDLLLLPSNKEENFHGFETQTIYAEELILAAKKGLITEKYHLKDTSHAINPKMLNNMPFFLLFQEHTMRSFCDSFFKKHRIKPQIKMEFSSNITCYRMSATGMALSLIPYLTTRLTQCEQEVELFSLGVPPVTWDVQVIYRQGSYLGQPENDFITIAQKVFSRETIF